MFRSLAVFAEVVVLIFLLQSSFVQFLFADWQQSLSDWMMELSQMADNAKLEELQSHVSPHFEAMRPFQQDYLKDVMSSKVQINHFYQAYCEKGDKNPFIYGASLRFFCGQIQQSELLQGKKQRSA